MWSSFPPLGRRRCGLAHSLDQLPLLGLFPHRESITPWCSSYLLAQIRAIHFWHCVFYFFKFFVNAFQKDFYTHKTQLIFSIYPSSLSLPQLLSTAFSSPPNLLLNSSLSPPHLFSHFLLISSSSPLSETQKLRDLENKRLRVFENQGLTNSKIQKLTD